MNERELVLLTERLSVRHEAHYLRAIRDLIAAKARLDIDAERAAMSRLNDTMRNVVGAAEAFGAQVSLRQAARLLTESNRVHMADRSMMAFRSESDILANVTFDAAVDDLVRRTPVVLRPAAKRTAARISQQYAAGRVIAFAKSADDAVTDRVQKLFTRAIAEGTAEAEVGRRAVLEVAEVARETEEWSAAYARMAFRTNLNTAVTAGRFAQAQDPDVKAVMPAFRYDAVNDADTRPNHAALDGVIWSVDSAHWQHHAPPNGWNCRCTVVAMSLYDLHRAGRLGPGGRVIESPVPPGAYPDPGFRHGGRPDLAQVTS